MDRTFFITTVTADRRRLFHSHATARLFLDVLAHYRGQGKYALHEFVVMPDHVHALLTPTFSLSLERAVQLIKGGFSFRLKSRFPVWQESFTNHRIRDAEDYAEHRRYIHSNPVRAGLVERAEMYPYSSAADALSLDEEPPGLKPTTERADAALKRRSCTVAPACADRTEKDQISVGSKLEATGLKSIKRAG